MNREEKKKTKKNTTIVPINHCRSVVIDCGPTLGANLKRRLGESRSQGNDRLAATLSEDGSEFYRMECNGRQVE